MNEKKDIKPEVPNSWGEDRRGFHIDKTISVGHLLSTIVVVVAGFTWVSKIEQGVNGNAMQDKYLEKQITQYKRELDSERAQRKSDKQDIEKRLEAFRQELKDDNRAINNKLDRIAEKLMK